MNKEIKFPLDINEGENTISVDKDDFGIKVRIPKEFSKYVKLGKWVLLAISIILMSYGYTLIVP